MKTFNSFHQNIIEVTHCKPEEAEEIQDYMQDPDFQHSIGKMTYRQFCKEARGAYSFILFLRSATGARYRELMRLSFN
jgi:hypothetical protein